jgi:pilus assembly protein CpaB
MRRRMLLFFLALLLAVGGTGAVLVYVSNADSRAVAAQQPITVVVVKHQITAGTKVDDAIAKGYLGTEQLARRAVPAGVLTSADTVKGLVALAPMYEGQLVVPALFGDQAPATTGIQLPAGMMALSVTATDAQHVGDFVQPGSEVAVFDTFTSWSAGSQSAPTAKCGCANASPTPSPSPSASKVPDVPSGDGLSQNFDYVQATRLLLPRVLVLAVGATTAAPATPSAASASASASPSPSPTATPDTTPTAKLLTLAVDQADAEKLILASQTGSLDFTLLTKGATATPGPGVNNHNIFDGR